MSWWTAETDSRLVNHVDLATVTMLRNLLWQEEDQQWLVQYLPSPIWLFESCRLNYLET